MVDIAIVTKDLTKRFGDFTAVDKVSFEVRKGEIFGFLGPNGAGKSTTIRMLCTLSRPSGGSATVAGHDIVAEDGEVREHIGLVSEKLIMYDELTIRENLTIFGKLYDMPDRKLKKRIKELVKLVHMEKWMDSRIDTFSTGMKQRVNVIRALVNEPEILFLDEPTLGLDPQSTSEIRNLIRKINKENGTTMILTTHMMVEADMICDRIGIIDRGKIVALDTPANLKKIISGTDTTTFEFEVPNLTNEMVTEMKTSENVLSVVREDPTKIKARAKGSDAFDHIVDALRKHGAKIRMARNLEPSLEDVFLHLTGREVRDEVTDKPRSTGGRRHGPGGGHHHRASNGRGR